jgi:glycosyltransferase involved in cell wall biosynthesis
MTTHPVDTNVIGGAPTTDALTALYLSGAPRLSTSPNTESLGPRSHILGVVNAMRASGLTVVPFIVGDSTPDAMHGEGSEARMGSSIPRLIATDLARVLYRLRSRYKLRRLLRSSPSPAFVYERYALLQELGSVARKPDVPWVLEVNALLAVEATTERRATFSKSVATWFERRTLRSADVVVAVTDNLAVAIADTYDIPTDRILVIENGVDTSVHEKASGAVAARPTIGFLGSLYPWQRVDELLLALSDPQNSEWTLRIAGTGSELTNLQGMSEELGVSDRVEFLGRVHPDDVPAFLQTVDICYAGHGSKNGVYFSPLKLWEYLAAGRAVVASGHATTRQLAAEGYAVACFDNSENPLTQVLATTLMDRQALVSLACARQTEVWQSYSWAARIRPLLRRIGALSD